jgi:hypothetical protein
MRIWLVSPLALVLSLAGVHAQAKGIQAIPFQSNPPGIWLFNTETGQLSRCESSNINQAPLCSPWSMAPGSSPQYRYDPKTGKLIPLNEAARQHDNQFKKSN